MTSAIEESCKIERVSKRKIVFQVVSGCVWQADVHYDEKMLVGRVRQNA
jgi:hypothetical protein